MSTTATKLLTAEEFAMLPRPDDGSRQELVRGKVVTMPPPRHTHGRTQQGIGLRVGMHLLQNPTGHLTQNSGIRTGSDPDTILGPDLAYWSKERLPLDADLEIYPTVPPDLAIEILSPSNTPRKMVRKIKEYFDHGVRMIWVVDPDFRTVTIYRKPGKGTTLWEDDTINGDDVLPGFTCQVGDFFPPAASTKLEDDE